MKKNFFLGIILILIGLVWLLNNLNIFSFAIFRVFFLSLSKLWPLLLIGLGINILLRKKKALKILTWLVIIAVILIYGFL